MAVRLNGNFLQCLPSRFSCANFCGSDRRGGFPFMLFLGCTDQPRQEQLPKLQQHNCGSADTVYEGLTMQSAADKLRAPVRSRFSSDHTSAQQVGEPERRDLTSSWSACESYPTRTFVFCLCRLRVCCRSETQLAGSLL